MEPAVYEQINAEIAEVVTNMSPIEHTYHLNKMGVKFMDNNGYDDGGDN